jgi:hypothetical protein
VYEGDNKPTFRAALLGQIKALRKQLDNDTANHVHQNASHQPSDSTRNVHYLLDALSESVARGEIRRNRPEDRYDLDANAHSIRALMDALSESLEQSNISQNQVHNAGVEQRHFTAFPPRANQSAECKAILDRISSPDSRIQGGGASHSARAFRGPTVRLPKSD